MPRPIKEKVRDVRWWGEQAAHAVAGAAAALPFTLLFHFVWPTEPLLLVSAVTAGGLAGATRELVQNWDDAPGDNDLLDSHFDSMFFLLGAFVMVAPFA